MVWHMKGICYSLLPVQELLQQRRRCTSADASLVRFCVDDEVPARLTDNCAGTIVSTVERSDTATLLL